MSSFPELKAERLVSRKTLDLRFLRYPFRTSLYMFVFVWLVGAITTLLFYVYLLKRLF